MIFLFFSFQFLGQTILKNLGLGFVDPLLGVLGVLGVLRVKLSVRSCECQKLWGSKLQVPSWELHCNFKNLYGM